ncbi:SufE family protein [Fulvivirga sp. RKSG066]|uniref:SufE family protein n=1 Tax=Fulvivirga aurantia TaxID=2529383 RepID=UPI0012BBDA4F|nr:SufE family protein [Fulvivirga aurantia]MTI22675.1 SufE family protein [Fulvivirga aurantia]
MPESIKDIQENIVEEFAILDGDQEMTNFYIMELGQKLDDLDESHKTEDNIVKGCQSKVWLTANLDGDRVVFQADSNTAITKGLVSLLVRILSGQKADDIVNADLFFPERIGMDRFIGTQRSNGFAAMIKQMKMYAFAFKSKIEA